MLNEERVKQMTKIALFEKEEGTSILPMIHYSKKDYLALRMIASFIAGTVFYWLLYIGLALAVLMLIMPNLNTIRTILGIVVGIVGYITYMYFYLRLMYRKAGKRYDAGRQKQEQLAKEYRILEQMYQEEEGMEKPEGWD